MDRSNLWRTFNEIDGMRPRLIRRVERTVAAHVVVVSPSFLQHEGCRICPDPVKHNNGRAEVCSGHFQSHQRRDRQWKERAVITFEEMALGTYQLALLDDTLGEDGDFPLMAIAYRVRAKTGRPLFTRSEEGVQGSGSGSGEGIVEFFVSLGLFPEKYLRLARRARQGGGGIDD